MTNHFFTFHHRTFGLECPRSKGFLLLLSILWVFFHNFFIGLFKLHKRSNVTTQDAHLDNVCLFSDARSQIIDNWKLKPNVESKLLWDRRKPCYRPNTNQCRGWTLENNDISVMSLEWKMSTRTLWKCNKTSRTNMQIKFYLPLFGFSPVLSVFLWQMFCLPLSFVFHSS